MADNVDIGLWQIVLGATASFFGGLGLYHNKKISDLSEKYMTKMDCTNYRTGVKDDFQRLEDSMKADFLRLEDKMINEFNRLYDALERRQNPRNVLREEG